jgi:hypothetical protein
MFISAVINNSRRSRQLERETESDRGKGVRRSKSLKGPYMQKWGDGRCQEKIGTGDQ